MRGRPCKYGPRGENGKCPPKPKTKKMRGRPCKYGPRSENGKGKCPPKPKTKKMRGRPCKHGARKENGKCPRKPKNVSVKKSKSPSPIQNQNRPERDMEDLEVFLYIGNKKRMFDMLSFQELESIGDKVVELLKCKSTDIEMVGDDEDRMVVHNVKHKISLDKKIQLKLDDEYLRRMDPPVELEFRVFNA